MDHYDPASHTLTQATRDHYRELETLICWAQALYLQKIDARANRISATAGGKPTSPAIAGLLISPGGGGVGSDDPLPGQGAPGLLISPAYAGTLSANATIAAVQKAFTDFIVGLLFRLSGS